MLTLWSPKGGSGTSVAAAAVALTLARTEGCRLVDLGGDQPAVLGIAQEPVTGVAEWLAAPDSPFDALDHLAVEVVPGLTLVPRGGAVPDGAGGERLAAALGAATLAVVVDASSACVPPALSLAVARRSEAVVAVIRPCYLALRRAVGHELLAATSGLIVIEEPGRGLRASDVSRVLDRPAIHVGRAEVRVARAVDAGSLTAHVPPPLARLAKQVLEHWPRGETTRWDDTSPGREAA